MKGWFRRNRGIELTDEQAKVAWDEATQPGGPPIHVAPILHIKQIVSSNLLTHYSVIIDS